MADNTTLNAGTGGDTYRAEDVGAGVKIGVSKVYTGAHGTDGGPVTEINPLFVLQQRASTGTQTSVSGSASDVTILAQNTARFGATIYNDSTAVLYLLCASAVSSATNYSVQLQPNDYFELIAGYTGIVKGIWGSATGSARVTEFT